MGVGVGFCGVSATPKFSFLLHFSTTLFAVCGFSKPKFFKHFQIFEKISLDETPHSQRHFVGKIWPNFGLFAKNGRFSAQNPRSLTISAPSAPKFDFFRPPLA